MKANGIAQELFKEAGYTYEYPGYWQGPRGLTIADGLSDNGIMWEVQHEGCISAGPFEHAHQAIEWAFKLRTE